MTTREVTYRDALCEALREELERDPRVFLLGEDINGGPGGYGGAFKVTKGLMEDFGDRLLDTPIAEQTIVGAAVGAAMSGLRPVAEIMYEDFLTLGMDMLVNTAAKTYFVTGGQWPVPMVVRAPCGALGIGPQHSQTFTSWFMHVPGLKLACPATPYDAKGLLKTAIRDPNPVIFLEHKKLYNVKGEVPEVPYLVPFGQARTVCPGKDVTLIAIGYLAYLAEEAAANLAVQGISAEVIDPRTLTPLDMDTILASVRRTHKAVVAAEDCRRAGPTAEIAATIAEACFEYLDAPVARVGARDTFIAHNAGMSAFVVPGSAEIEVAVRQVVDWH
jgi:acetoin:2,6-dichlorophenolindophenol oxidoreductase subunit beta